VRTDAATRPSRAGRPDIAQPCAPRATPTAMGWPMASPTTTSAVSAPRRTRTRRRRWPAPSAG